jgi:hypothetical protein
MTISRRGAIKTLGAAVPAFRLKAEAPSGRTKSRAEENSRSFRLQAELLDPALLAAIADVVLPAEADRKAAVAAFTSWIADYKEGADTDHGYGNTRVRATGPSPARNYPAQIAALDAAATARGAASFAAASLEQRRALVEAAIADAKVERLPARPTGAHIATDLMGHYFNSSAANDLCYRAAIGRDACRGLAGSERRPAALPPGDVVPPKGGSYR